MNSRLPGMNLLLNSRTDSRDLGEIDYVYFTEDCPKGQHRGQRWLSENRGRQKEAGSGWLRSEMETANRSSPGMS